MLVLRDEAFTLGQSFAFLIGEDRRSLFASGEKCLKQCGDLRCVFLAARDPCLGVGQVVTAQQQIVGCPGTAISCLPPRGGLAQARMFANPFDILPERLR